MKNNSATVTVAPIPRTYRITYLGAGKITHPDFTSLAAQIPAAQKQNLGPFTFWSGPEVAFLSYGVAWSYQGYGENRFQDIGQAWQKLHQQLVAVPSSEKNHLPPQGLKLPIAFGCFGFNEGSSAHFILPKTTLAYIAGHCWQVDIDPHLPAVASAATLNSDYTCELQAAPPVRTFNHWANAVDAATTQLADSSQTVEKVVLARDRLYTAQPLPPIPTVLDKLTTRYPNCWTFKIGDLFGASPEMLTQVKEGKLVCRVLAGTCRPGLEKDLWNSPKERKEHALAVASAAENLKPLLPQLQIPAEPFLLRLHNVTHLATDLIADLKNLPDSSNLLSPTPTLATETETETAVPQLERTGLTALDIAGFLHPTAAVCGYPKDAASQLLCDLDEPERGHYAAPVGWLDTDGNGEWAIALRCAQVVTIPRASNSKIELETETMPHLETGAKLETETGVTSEKTAKTETVSETGAKVSPAQPTLAYRLWAGAGIMPQSTPKQEWLETEAKMQAVALALVNQ